MRLPERLVSCLGLGVAGLIALALIFPSPLLFSATVRTGWMVALAAGGVGALLGCAGILFSPALSRRKVAAAMVSGGVVLQLAVSLAAWNDLGATPGLAQALLYLEWGIVALLLLGSALLSRGPDARQPAPAPV